MATLDNLPRTEPSPVLSRWRRTGFGWSVAAALFLWFGVHALALEAALIEGLPSLAALLTGIALLILFLPRRHPYPVFGWANAVTLARAGLALSLITPLVAMSAGGWAVAAIAALALALDGVDGILARRHGRVSEFGARFDMEVDSLLALLLAILAWAGGIAGPVVLLLGLARYLFVAATWLLPWLGGPLPERFSRKAVCVVQIGALIALQVPLLPTAVIPVLVWGTVAALAWSFATDIVWLARHRR